VPLTGTRPNWAVRGAFAGTRVPVASLFEHLDRGSTINEFLGCFPSVSRDQMHQVLAFAKSSLEQPATALALLG
jgi:uncharacterized protein (DUF433 family)